jgi:general secretion pathway protein G
MLVRKSLHRRRAQAGFTLAELVMVAAVLVALSAVTLPVAKFTAKRSKEADLRLDLREMRSAIDEYKRYPKNLEVLVKGVDLVGQVNKKMKFLRRLPIDPMTGKDEWGLRSFQDEATATSWGGEDVYDVYSLSAGVGLNKVPYRKW